MDKRISQRKKLSVSDKVKMAKKELFEINATLKKINMIVEQLPSDMEIDYLTQRRAKINSFLKKALNIDIKEGEDGLVADIDSEGADVNVEDEGKEKGGEGGEDEGGEGDYLGFGDEGGEDEFEGEPDEVVKMNKFIERKEAELRIAKRKKAMLMKKKQ